MGSLSSQSISQFYVYTLVSHSVLIMGSLENLRTHMTADDESAFKISGNEVSFVVVAVALLAVEVTSAILFWTNIMSNYYAVLKFIGLVSANVASFSIMKVMDNTQEHFSVMYLLRYILFFQSMAYYFFGYDKLDRTLDKTSFISILTFTGLVLEPISLVLVLFVPKNVNWIVVSVVHLTMVMEVFLFLAVFVNFAVLDWMLGISFRGIQQEKQCKVQEEKDNNDMEAQMKSSFT